VGIIVLTSTSLGVFTASYSVLNQHLEFSTAGSLVGDRCMIVNISYLWWVTKANWFRVDTGTISILGPILNLGAIAMETRRFGSGQGPELKGMGAMYVGANRALGGRHVPAPHMIKKTLGN
jgi:hypothetical protein